MAEKAESDAGEDKKILTGQSVELNGKAIGDGTLTYLWSPTIYLDNPNKLNPIASPPTDITYTLTVISGCNEATDNVSIKVYPKIEIPNTFSPNGDGINDVLNYSDLKIKENPSMQIFNREGTKVFQSENQNFIWNGKIGGRALPGGTYWYVLTWTEPVTLIPVIHQGWILLKNRD